MVPTISRHMWFFAVSGMRAANGGTILDDTQPCDAVVVFVHNDTSVNIIAYDHIGEAATIENVYVRQDPDKLLYDGSLMNATGKVHEYWVEWMPYQKQVAAEREGAKA